MFGQVQSGRVRSGPLGWFGRIRSGQVGTVGSYLVGSLLQLKLAIIIIIVCCFLLTNIDE